MLLNVLVSCVAAALTALAMFCVVVARGSEQGKGSYSGDSSAVAGVWLAFLRFIGSALRASNSHLIWPVSTWLMFSTFGLMYSPQYTEVAKALSFLRQLLLAVLTGIAISTGVSLFILPTTNRQHYFNTVRTCAAAMKSALEGIGHDIRSVQNGTLAGPVKIEEIYDGATKHESKRANDLAAQLTVDLSSAQHETALGKLGPENLQDLHDHMIAISGLLANLAALPDVAGRTLPLAARSEKLHQHLLAAVVDCFSQGVEAMTRGSTML
jgi:hypothetical protein